MTYEVNSLMLPDKIRSDIEAQLAGEITGLQPVGGGSINHAARFETNGQRFFIKWNDAKRYPGMFEAETKGLNLIRELSGMIVPEVFHCGTTDNLSYLLLEFLEQDIPCWNDAGFILANMHSMMRGKMFGLDHDNHIGSLPQSNTPHPTWQEFYSQQRIIPQMKRAVDAGKLTTIEMRSAETFCSKISEIFPEEQPSLLHGDLWSGNFMFSVRGPAVIDPAVYFGHREMDLAMTKLFGGFDSEFYEGYNEFQTLEKNWEKRIDYCNLYPLLVHVNLFGGGYVQDVKRILSHFT